MIRLGIDGVYTIGKLSYDGVYYMVYGSVKTTDEHVLSKVEDLEKQIMSDSCQLREIKTMIQEMKLETNNK
jgi:hypothetical protein